MAKGNVSILFRICCSLNPRAIFPIWNQVRVRPLPAQLSLRMCLCVYQQFIGVGKNWEIETESKKL